MPGKNSENVVCGEMSLSVCAKKIAQLHEDTLPTLLGRVGAPRSFWPVCKVGSTAFGVQAPVLEREEKRQKTRQNRRGEEHDCCH